MENDRLYDDIAGRNGVEVYICLVGALMAGM